MSPADADLIGRDRDLPDLAFLLDSELIADRLARTLIGSRVDNVGITYLRYKPGQSCIAACRASVDGQTTDLVAATYRRSAAGKLHKVLTRRNVPGPFGPGRLVLDGSTVLVSVFPNDTKLDRLFRLMSPDALTALTARLRPLHGATVRLETLRYNPQRRFVGRLVADEATLATVRCYTAQDYAGIVAKAGALTSRGPLRLARRLTRMHRLCLLAFEWMHGELLEEAVGRRTVAPQRMELVGAALAHLHEQDAPTLPRHMNASEARALAALAGHLAFLHPPLGALALSLAERIATRLQHETAKPRPLHGDFYAKQVLLDGTTAALIDLDEASLGDPAIDLARFRADLEASAVSGRLASADIDTLFEPLMAGYCASQDAPARLPVHTAAQLFRLAAHPFRRREASWPDIATAILERAEALLMQDAKGCSAPSAPAVPPRVIDRFRITKDPLMPFLARALSPECMAEGFARELCGLGRLTSVDILNISVTRYKRGMRCLIAYDVAVHPAFGEVRHETLIGKVRAQSADASTHELLETLWTGTFGACAEDGILVPEPLGLVGDVHMSVQRRVPGESLGPMLEGASGLGLARRAADAIRKLHSASPRARRRHTVDDELRILRRRLTEAALERPGDATRLERLFDGCIRLAERVRGGTVCGIHRDFYPDQLLVDGDRLYVTDLDLYSEGPPALDVGNFVAHVQEYSLRRFGDPDHLADRNDMLIERYLQLSNGTTREAIDIWTTLSLARHVAISTQFPDRRPFTAAILDLCEHRVTGRAAEGAHR